MVVSAHLIVWTHAKIYLRQLVQTMPACNLRVIKPRSVIPALHGTGSPIQSEIILELFADVKVAVVDYIASWGLNGVVASENFHAEGIVIGNMCFEIGIVSTLLQYDAGVAQVLSCCHWHRIRKRGI